MKKVMPEKDKQTLIEWLGVHDPMSTSSSIQHNNTIPVGMDCISSFLSISTERELVTYLNTLLYVISKYLDPREHYTERGIIMTFMYDLISRHTSLGGIDENIEMILQPLDYWTLLGVCVHTVQSTSLRNKCDIKKLLDERLTLEEDRERLDKNTKHASKQISFNVSSDNALSVAGRKNKNFKLFSLKGWQDSFSFILSLFGLIMFLLHVFDIIVLM